jgi:hypothetical protein
MTLASLITPAEFFELNFWISVEREFFLSLSLADCKALTVNPDIPETYLNMSVACHQRHHVEILLTLKGLKPCTGIHHHTATHIFTRM